MMRRRAFLLIPLASLLMKRVPRYDRLVQGWWEVPGARVGILERTKSIQQIIERLDNLKAQISATESIKIADRILTSISP